MNVFLTILFSILGLVVLILVIAAVSRKAYQVTKETIIAKPRAEVFAYIRLLKNQDHYSKWVMTDPAAKKTFKGIDGTPGFIYGWNGNKKAGEGEQEILRITEGSVVDTEVRFVRPFAGVAGTSFFVEDAAVGQTKLKWSFNSQIKYPMNIMLLLGLEKMLGRDMELSLSNLKTVLEK